MKSNISILSILFILLISGLTNAQSIESAKNLYQNGDYERAIRIFKSINTTEADLYLGKSYFAQADYLKAKSYLNKVISANSNDDFSIEAKYTKSLVLFQLDDFSATLDLLYDIKTSKTNTSLYRQSLQFYDQLLNYLSINQIRTVFRQTTNPEILVDVISGALGRVDYAKAKVLLSTFKYALVATLVSPIFWLIRPEYIKSSTLFESASNFSLHKDKAS